ncbi:hypothetical protein [Chromobacterium violaceum]|uniref:hypothetical protein n=1 Tax=Chromobacterium violaceum TaxID=536 RepID=UPI0015FE17FF|nr:hypothetical protein [Chromobacterium violaceum]MBA8735805.1 hypothetical protein [Chromobacterium violaceum]
MAEQGRADIVEGSGSAQAITRTVVNHSWHDGQQLLCPQMLQKLTYACSCVSASTLQTENGLLV